MRILGRYFYPLVISIFLLTGIFVGLQVSANHSVPGAAPTNPYLFADPNPAGVNVPVHFTAGLDGHQGLTAGPENNYTYYFWKNCPGGTDDAVEWFQRYEKGGALPSNDCGQENSGYWDRKGTNVNSFNWDLGYHSYEQPGSYLSVILVSNYCNAPNSCGINAYEFSGNSLWNAPLVIESGGGDYMDVTPDDGVQSGSKPNESNNGGPRGLTSVAPGATTNYEATFDYGNSGNEAGYRFFMYDPAGNLRPPTPSTTTGYRQLSSDGQTISQPFTFGYGSGTYRVCARGAQEDGLFTGGSLEARLDNKVLGWISSLFGVAHADFTGVGASDQECKNVTVANVKLYAETAPGSGVWNDVSVSIPYDTATNLRWESGGLSCVASNASPPKSNWSGSRQPDSSQSTGALTESTTYTITCPSGGASDPVTVFVDGSPPPPPPPPPVGSTATIDLKLDGQLEGPGGQLQKTPGYVGSLTWSTSGEVNGSCRGSLGPSSWNGARANDEIDGRSTGTLNTTTTFRLTCVANNTGEDIWDEVTVYIPRAAEVTLRADANGQTNLTGTIWVKPGSIVDLKWYPRHSPKRCFVPLADEREGWSGDKEISGSNAGYFTRVTPVIDTSYRMRCENDNGGNPSNTITVRMTDAWTELYLNGNLDEAPISAGTAGALTWKNGAGIDECRTLSGDWLIPGPRNAAPGTESPPESTGVLNANKTYTLQCREHRTVLGFGCTASTEWDTNNFCIYSDSTVNAIVEEAGDFEVLLSARVGSTGTFTTQDNGISGQVPLNGVDLKADITFASGSGQYTYTFYCIDGAAGDLPIGPTSDITKLNDAPCDYATAGVKTAKVVVQRGIVTKQDTIQINVTTPPSDSPILTNPPEPGPFCNAGQYLSYDFTWSDQDQTAWEIQIDEDANFGSPFPSSKTAKTPPGGSHTYTPVVGTLAENTSYYWRVRTWDEFDVASNWTNGVRFTTWPYKGPRVRWVITSPEGGPPYPTETQIVFDNTTIYYGGSNFTYLWEYDNEDPTNAPANSTSEDGNAIYTSIGDGNKRVRLTVTDPALGESCFYQNRINMGTGLDLPIFREIIPR